MVLRPTRPEIGKLATMTVNCRYREDRWREQQFTFS